MYRYVVPILLALLFTACGDDVGIVDPDIEPDLQRVPLDSLLAGDLSLAHNPNEITPLSALASFQTIAPARVTVNVLGDESETRSFSEATTHEIPILGLYPNRENRVVLRVLTGNTLAEDTLRITTDPLPDFLPTIEVTTASRRLMEDGMTLSSLSIGTGDEFASHPIMFDASGNIRWYMDLSSFGGIVFLVERLNNGNLLFGHGNAIYEYDMLGTEINRWDIPGYWFHHDVIEKPDGNLLVAVNKSNLDTVEDHVIEVDRASGAVVNEWDLRQVLDVDRFDYIENETDWFHMNAIWYDAEDDALLLSGRNQSAVVKVTADNELVWILSPHKGWGRAGLNGDGHETSDYLLTAVDASGNPYPDAVQQGTEDVPGFSWSWGQHAPLLLPNGNLFLFDNGLNRTFSSSAPTYSRGVEYVIDEEAMTVQQVWQYGKARGEAFYSSIISDVDYLSDTGNRLVMPGIVTTPGPRAYVTEVTSPSKEVVFEASIEFKNQLSSGDMSWGNFDLVYRSERLPLYPHRSSANASMRWTRR